MPFVAKQVRSCSMAAWHVGEGDHFDFGTDLCDVLITEVEGKKDTIGPHYPVPARYRVRIRSSEAGILGSILIAEGRDVSVGDLLAVVSTDQAEPTDRLPPVGAPALRVIADPIRPGGED
jgi:pyruvate/2-oxoglutarate dehydrogenase complex dihydrolipoamide acyltransferase (E2) component